MYLKYFLMRKLGCTYCKNLILHKHPQSTGDTQSIVVLEKVYAITFFFFYNTYNINLCNSDKANKMQ